MSKNRTSRSSGRAGNRGAISVGAFEMFRRPQRSTPALAAVVIWRWRWELLFTALLVAVFLTLTDVAGLSPVAVALIMFGAFIAVFSLPVLRQWAVTRVMCVIVRHRLRVCLAEMRTLNYSGYLPLIVHMRGTPVGLVAYLWMRPGLSITDLDNRTEHLATACWAREVRVQRSRRVAALVRVDIVRRDPLGASAPITSSLLATTAAIPAIEPGGLPDTVLSGIVHPAPATTVAGFDTDHTNSNADNGIGIGIGTDPGADAGSTATATTTRSRKTKKSTTTTPDSPAVVINGEDVSDYV